MQTMCVKSSDVSVSILVVLVHGELFANLSFTFHSQIPSKCCFLLQRATLSASLSSCACWVSEFVKRGCELRRVQRSDWEHYLNNIYVTEKNPACSVTIRSHGHRHFCRCQEEFLDLVWSVRSNSELRIYALEWNRTGKLGCACVCLPV